MKYTHLVASALIFFFLIGNSSALAAVDYFLKIEGVEGESSATGALQIQAKPATDSETGKGGNVESGWKVEEGEGIAPTNPSDAVGLNPQPDPPSRGKATPKLIEATTSGNFVGGHSDRPLAGVYIKLGDIKGEFNDDRTSSSGSFTASSEINVSGVEVRGWDPETKEAVKGSAVTNPRTPEELALFIAHAVSEDELVENVSLNYTKIEWEYKSHGRLLGFVPVTFKKVISVPTDSEGKIKVRFPWYRFLMTVDVRGDELASSLEAALQSEGDLAGLNPQPEPPSISVLAQKFQTLSNVSKTLHDIAMSSIRNLK